MTSHIQIERLTPAIGAVVSGLDTRTLDADEVQSLISLWLEHKVLFLPDQHLDESRLCELGSLFGELMRLPYIEPVAGYPEVIRVLKEADENAGGVFGGEWHTDFSFLANPPAASLLYAIDLPQVGGDTLWTNMALAWQQLPDNIRETLRGRSAVHVGAPYGQQHAPTVASRSGASIRIERGNPEADQEQHHPAIVEHPETGERILNVNPTYTTRIDGLDKEESDALLATLFEHSIRPEFCCRFRWRPNTLAIWDNRSTMHYAINDYAGHRRELIRVTTRGESPRAAS